MKTIITKTFALMVILALGFLYGSCEKDKDELKITGCNTFEYQGTKYPPYQDYNICTPGTSYQLITGFKVGNEPVSFDIECTNSCITSVTVVK